MNTQSNWTEATKDYDRERGGERWIRKLGDDCWLSCLHRLTGFGHMEWETALCIVLPVEGRERTWRDQTCDIVLGDRREQFNDMTREQVIEWYKQNKDKHPNSMGQLIAAIKEAAQ